MTASLVVQPEITIALANANQAVQNTAQRVLMVGQQTGAATATAGELQEDVRDDFPTLFGADSMLAAMIRGFRKVNPVVQIDAIPLDDNGGGTQRVVDFTITGTATSGGTITIIAGSEIDHRFVVAIANGDDATAAAGKVVAAINADTTVPFTASNVAGAVSLTAVHAGAVANDLGVEVVSVDTPGLAIASVTETTPGAGDPTLTAVLDPAVDRYQTIVWPYSDTTVVQAYLVPRFNPTNAILDGVAVLTIQDTFANVEAVADAENDPSLVIFGDEQISETLYLGPAKNEASYVKSAIFAGIRSLRLTDGQVITRFLTTGASLDQFGGTALASMPYFNTPVDVLPTNRPNRGWTRQEIEDLLDAGISIMGDNPPRTGALIGEVVTTYKTDPAGNPDVTFGFLNYVDTASNVREYMFNNLRARFAQSRLTEGAVSRGRSMANEGTIAAYLDKLYIDLAGPDFVLVQDGEEAIRFFKQNRTVTLDLSQGLAVVTMVVPIVTQLRTINATLKIAFSVAA